MLRLCNCVTSYRWRTTVNQMKESVCELAGVANCHFWKYDRSNITRFPPCHNRHYEFNCFVNVSQLRFYRSHASRFDSDGAFLKPSQFLISPKMKMLIEFENDYLWFRSESHSVGILNESSRNFTSVEVNRGWTVSS